MPKKNENIKIALAEGCSVKSVSQHKADLGLSWSKMADRYGASTAQEAIKWKDWVVIIYPDGTEKIGALFREYGGE